MKKLLALLCLSVVCCGRADHEKERKDVCEHSEGYADGDCNAGDDFTPLTCLTAMDQLEGWWRGDAQSGVNNCLVASSCYAKADGVPGPSIQVPLQLCMGVELFSNLKPTDAETNAVARYCTKASSCGELENYTILDCEEVLLSPFDDGQLFLIMNDQVSLSVANCDKSSCADFDGCVLNALHLAGAFNSVMGASIKMPKFLRLR